MDDITQLRPSFYYCFMSKIDPILEQLRKENHKLKTQLAACRAEMRANEDLPLKLKQAELNLEIAHERCTRAERKIEEQQALLKEDSHNKRQGEYKLMQELELIKNQALKWQLEYQKLQKELQLKQILQKEHSRIFISSAIHHTQQQLQKAKLQFQHDYLIECEQLRMQIKEKDQKLKFTLKKLHNYQRNTVREEEEFQEYERIVRFIKEISSIEDLNATLHKMKAEILTLRKEVKELENKNALEELRNNELLESFSKLTLECDKKKMENKDLKFELGTAQGQLEKQRKFNKQLQTYFSKKWLQEYDIFRSALQKAYEGRLAKLKAQFQQRISSINTSQETFHAIHEQDTKIICSLQEQITVLSTEIKESKETIVKLQTQNTEIKMQMKEVSKMILEVQKTITQKAEEKMKEKEVEIQDLKKIINKAETQKEVFQKKITKLKKNLKETFQCEKKELQKKLIKQIEEKVQQKVQIIDNLLKKQEMDQLKQKGKEESLKYQFQTEIIRMKDRHKKQAQEQQKIVQKSRQSVREAIVNGENREKTLISEFQAQKKAISKEMQKQRKDLEEKVIAIRSLHQKAKHDDNLKRQLRYLYDIKAKQCNQIIKENEMLTNELIEKENLINQLNSLRLNNSLQDIIVQLKTQFKVDLLALNEIHWKQIQIHRNKVHQLQSIICRRHREDQQKMVNLYSQNEMLQTKLQLLQRKNSEQSPPHQAPTLSSINFIQPRKNLFISKKKRRGNFHFSQTILKNQKESSTAAAIIRMKRFLERGKSTDAEQVFQNSQRYLKNAFKSPHSKYSTDR